MWFELWETGTANLIEEFDTERAALAFVRAAACKHGREYVLTWGLARLQDGADSKEILSGDKLADRALRGAVA